jgi:hypothetical protein
MPAVMKPTSPAASSSRAAGARRHQQDLVARLQRTLHHAHQHDDADVVVEPRVDQQRLQRRIAVALRRRHARDHRFQDVVDPFTGLGTRADRVFGDNADDVLDLVDHPLGLSGRQVDLVQHRHHFDALLDGRVAVRNGLRFDALRCIDDEQRALAGGERSRHLVRKVDVARRVDQVQPVRKSVARDVSERRRLRLDRDAALALEVHRIEHLGLHFAIGQSATALDEPVGKRRLAVIDVRDDREIADVQHGKSQRAPACGALSTRGRRGDGRAGRCRGNRRP